jgi:hypothetical protein
MIVSFDVKEIVVVREAGKPDVVSLVCQQLFNPFPAFSENNLLLKFETPRNIGDIYVFEKLGMKPRVIEIS